MSKKIEVKRQSVFVDMTAMCDMAFLLLTFFILTAKFRPNEPVVVDVPASRAQIPIPESNIMLISVDNTGRVFMGIDNAQTKRTWLGRLGEKFNFQPTEEMAKKFTGIEQFGVDPVNLPAFLALSPSDLGKFNQPGITTPDPDAPTDSINVNVLKECIYLARMSHEEEIQNNPALESMRIAIKADKDADYSMVQRVIATLVDSKIQRFNLITSAKPGTAE
jgi:biopolymer transport protein ExbD